MLPMSSHGCYLSLRSIQAGNENWKRTFQCAHEQVGVFDLGNIISEKRAAYLRKQKCTLTMFLTGHGDTAQVSWHVVARAG